MPKKPSGQKSADISIVADDDVEETSSSVSLTSLEAMFTHIVGAVTASFNSAMDRVLHSIEDKLSIKLEHFGKEIFDMNIISLINATLN